MSDCKWFKKFDIKNTYNEIKIDEASRDCTTIGRPKSRFKYKRLPVEIKTGSSILVIVIGKLLGDLRYHGVNTYFDDILIANKRKEERFEAVKILFGKNKK